MDKLLKHPYWTAIGVIIAIMISFFDIFQNTQHEKTPSIILKANIHSNSHLSVFPTNNKIYLEEINLIVPSILSYNNYTYSLTKNKIILTEINEQIENLLLKRTKKEIQIFNNLNEDKTFGNRLIKSKVPIVIQSNYIYDSNKNYNSSIYTLEYVCAISAKKAIILKLIDMKFSRKLQENENAQSIVDQLFIY